MNIHLINVDLCWTADNGIRLTNKVYSSLKCSSDTVSSSFSFKDRRWINKKKICFRINIFYNIKTVCKEKKESVKITFCKWYRKLSPEIGNSVSDCLKSVQKSLFRKKNDP